MNISFFFNIQIRSKFFSSFLSFFLFFCHWNFAIKLIIAIRSGGALLLEYHSLIIDKVADGYVGLG